ncbi:MAG TPA: DUF1572 family protein [Mucilaginibacter sp.]|nr:DUF1572 family protein [Mucilaginibacter sp.]
MIGDRSFAPLGDAQLNWRFNGSSNSIATIIKHIAGNSISRWTDFLKSDGEKAWRDRDSEFEDGVISKIDLIILWEKGWKCLFDAINSLTDDDLLRTVYIRNEPHTVMEAINRQLSHLPYHIGQIIYIAKMQQGGNFKSLTIPKGESKNFNAIKFNAGKDDSTNTIV